MHSQSSSTFFKKLPAEIRLQIYNHVVTFERPIRLLNERDPSPSDQPNPGPADKALQALTICKRMSLESEGARKSIFQLNDWVIGPIPYTYTTACSVYLPVAQRLLHRISKLTWYAPFTHVSSMQSYFEFDDILVWLSRYQKHHSTQHLNLTVKVLVGPNWESKHRITATNMLWLVSGLETPYLGRLRVQAVDAVMSEGRVCDEVLKADWLLNWNEATKTWHLPQIA